MPKRTDINQVEIWNDISVTTGVTLGEDDAYANEFGAMVMMDGQPLSLDGAEVQGLFIRPGRETITIEGSSSGNVASVTLTPECYDKAGWYHLTLKVIIEGVTITLRIIEGRIVTTNSGIENTVPAEGSPTIKQLLDRIKELEKVDVSNEQVLERLTALENESEKQKNRIENLAAAIEELQQTAGSGGVSGEELERIKDRLDNHAAAIETCQIDVTDLEVWLYSRMFNGWPVISPDEALHGIFVRDDGTLYTGEYIEE